MDDLSQFKATYIQECYELLADMEQHLLSLDTENADLEKLNAIFRCAHSIKGGAGAFGFSAITKFTHVAEFLLDAMREGKVSATQEIVDALLKSSDLILQMVRMAEEGTTPPDGFGADLMKLLEKFANSTSSAPVATSKPAAPPAVAEEESGFFLYNISFAPHRELLRTGNEPLLLIRELASLGKITTRCMMDSLPALEMMDPALCYFAWEIELETDKPERAIRDVFEFVEDCCDLTISCLGGFFAPSAPEPEAEAPHEEDALEPAAPPSKSMTEAAAKAEDSPAAKATASGSIRVDIDKVDRLVNLVGELVITQSMLVAQARQLGIDDHGALIRGIEELSQHTRELQEAVMSVRMQPVRSIFSRMPRIVRDIAGKLGKKIQLEMHGEATEVDKTVIEQLADPLTHMIRNAADHGIEKPEKRREAGKSEEGTIRLSAAHQGGKIVIEVRDDGGGINRDRVLEIARNKKLVPQDAQLSPYEIDQLIFAPGFSTAEAVTDISGRGVGMDVVRRNIEAIGGTVFITSTPGMGSRFTITLPLTLAILDGMIVRVGVEHYIVPIADILETLRPLERDIHTVADGNDLINVRGEFISVLYLGDLFAVRGASTKVSEALVVLVENGSEKFGLVVDELIGQQQVVIKSLEGNSDPVPGISGATILGDGMVSLILDIPQLYSLAHALPQRHEQTTPSA